MASTLTRELRQTIPFTNLQEEVFLSILRTGDALIQAEARLLRKANLSFAQYNVLRILRGAGKQGATCGDIAGRMVNRDPDVTRLLDRLEERGLVERARDEQDRRIVVGVITSEGLQILKALDKTVPTVHRTQLAHMTRKQLQTLVDLLALARTPTV
jgi:DNA-binding MarR family transcriptional regulator